MFSEYLPEDYYCKSTLLEPKFFCAEESRSVFLLIRSLLLFDNGTMLLMMLVLLLGCRERGFKSKILPVSIRLMFSLRFCPVDPGSNLVFSVGCVSPTFFTESSLVEKSGSSWIVTSLVSLVCWISLWLGEAGLYRGTDIV